ncbi:GNAT family N-acetyltransferase [Alsobacter sp. R-9]
MPASPTPSPRSRPAVAVHRDVAAVAQDWLRFEAQEGCTPYQRIGFVSTWFKIMSTARDAEPAVVEIRLGGTPVLLVPLEIARHGIARVARWPGGRQANLGGPILDPGRVPALDPRELGDRLVEAGGMLGIDGFAFCNQPAMIGGIPNPLAAMDESRPGSAPYSALPLQRDPEALLSSLLSPSTRKTFGKKRRGLASLGEVRIERATEQAGVERLLSAFLAQKSERMACQGIPNPFADPRLQDFLRAIALPGRDGEAPVLELYGLWCGDRPAAVFGAVATGQHLSGSFVSFSADPALSRGSPGELLIMEVIALAARRGLATFDLGIGRGSLKDRFCSDAVPLVDTWLPVTQLGGAALLSLRATAALKALVQRDPRLMRHVRHMAAWAGLHPAD